MGNRRYWMWVLVRLSMGVAVIAWALSYLKPGNGEKEFQKTLDAMKRVHSFRVAVSGMTGSQHDEMRWEVDCNRDLVHHQMHLVNLESNPPIDTTQDELRIADHQYRRASDGAWAQAGFAYQGATAKWFCGNLAQGTDTNLLPPIATMIRRGIIQKGDKKTVNGVRCREWLVTMKNGTANLAHDTVCLGLDDHLPYEMNGESERSHSIFFDYNATLQIDVPELAVQQASANASN